ncbi:MAG: DegT/DnrJ/EryC1/StrS family aminotransferase [Clostridia bacterium]|nr:DegT/DnrJ/EryC1/StrS family aminotransferase [Clostridia bacterium]
MNLAVHNNQPVIREKWPKWPIWIESAGGIIAEVAKSGRWSVRGSWTGLPCKEEAFSKLFAKYNRASYCAVTTSGSVSLLLALEALNIGPGDEVIVPALTWIAPVTAVLNAGAVPVMVDIDKDTTCIDPEEVRKAIGPKTKAIIPVHLHCSVADMDKIMKIAKEHDLYVIEDCSQAHGAKWGEHFVGTVGHVGVFSFNQEKVLTCGEGGALLTNDPKIFEMVFRTKTDGCSFDEARQSLGEDQLIYDSEFMGSNYCLSEFQAAILIAQLDKLKEWNEKREGNARYLDKHLLSIPGITPLKPYGKVTQRTYYEYAVRLDTGMFGGKDLADICNALSKETGFSIHPTDVPVYRNKLFSPWTKKRYAFYCRDKRFEELKTKKFPCCEEIYKSLAVFHHSILLAEREDMDDIIRAFEKVKKYSNEI